jgi:uncharacterized protein
VPEVFKLIRVRRLMPAVLLLMTLLVVGILSIAGYYVYRTQYLPSELRVAASSGSVQRVEELIRKGVDVNRELGLPSNSPLNRAIEAGNAAVVEVLLNAGANPNAIAETGMTPVMVAAFFGNAAIVDLLVRRGALLDAVEPRHGNTPLLIAVRKGHVAVVRVLLDAGAEPNKGRDWGDAPLCRAQAARQVEIAALLRQRGATCRE